MLIEPLLTAIGRKKTREYLTFTDAASIDLPEPEQGHPYLLYLHIPFCETLCPYCSFNRIPFETGLAERYFDALKKEMELYHRRGYLFEAVYVGGGTPTILPDQMKAVLEKARALWPIKQVSLETNPNHLTDEITSLLSAAGVNRLSVGVQTFDDNLLKTLGRFEKYGSGDTIIQRLKRYQGVFETLNVDMIYNFPDQTKAMVRKDLKVLQNLNVDQITYYPLMASRLRKEEMARDMGKVRYGKEKAFYRIIQQELSGMYTPVSAWCFSRKAGMIDEYIVDYPEYAGLGSGAFGYLGGAIYSNTFSVPDYTASLEKNILPLAGLKIFNQKERALYDLLMELFGGRVSPGAVKGILRKELLALRLSGSLKKKEGGLETTGPGRYRTVILMREFFNGVNNLREQRLRHDEHIPPCIYD